MGKVIGLVSLKGGVGKTTLSCALATDLAVGFGRKVLLVDANFSAPNVAIHMNIRDPDKTVHDVLLGTSAKEAIYRAHGLDVMPGNFLFEKEVSPLKLKNKINELKKNYDFIVLDSSPSLSDEILSTMLSSDALFLVTTPDFPTLSCSIKAMRLAKQRGINFSGIILNKSDQLQDTSVEQIQDTTGIPVVASVRSDEVVSMALHGQVPATLFSRHSKFSKDVEKLSMALTGVGETRDFFDRFLFEDVREVDLNRHLFREQFYERVFE